MLAKLLLSQSEVRKKFVCFVFRPVSYVVEVSISVTGLVFLAILGVYCYRHRQSTRNWTFFSAATNRFQSLTRGTSGDQRATESTVTQLRAESLAHPQRYSDREPSLSSVDSEPLNLGRESLVEIEEGTVGQRHVTNSGSLSVKPKQKAAAKQEFLLDFDGHENTLAEVLEKDALLKKAGAGAIV